MSSTELDPSIVPLADQVPFPSLNPETLAVVRASPMAAPVELSDAVERVDYVVSEDPYVVVRVHTPRQSAAGPRACVYSIHGGGYVMGSYEMDDLKFDALCPQYDCVGVSVEYRLAPETAYPGPLEDCYAGLAWVFENAEKLGVDPERVGIAGVSAGGGLAAGLALLVRDRGEMQLAWQLLDCPMIDDRQQTPSSQADGLLVWSRESNTFGWQSYLGELYGKADIPYHAAPARAEDLSGLPPAYVCVGGADGFRDEDIAYALRLNGAGVPCELHVYPGAPHGVMIFAATEVGQRYLRDQGEWLGRQLAKR
jgi:acetyl esterase/lipase